MSEQQAPTMTGKTFYLRGWRINVNRKGLDISNGMRGAFIFHPFTKHFSFKQYVGLYQWLIKNKTR